PGLCVKAKRTSANLGRFWQECPFATRIRILSGQGKPGQHRAIPKRRKKNGPRRCVTPEAVLQDSTWAGQGYACMVNGSLMLGWRPIWLGRHCASPAAIGQAQGVREFSSGSNGKLAPAVPAVKVSPLSGCALEPRRAAVNGGLRTPAPVSC